MKSEILCGVLLTLFKVTFWLCLTYNPGQSHSSLGPGWTCTGKTLAILSSPPPSENLRKLPPHCLIMIWWIPVSGSLSTLRRWRRQSRCTGSRRTARPPASGSWRSEGWWFQRFTLDGNTLAVKTNICVLELLFKKIIFTHRLRDVLRLLLTIRGLQLQHEVSITALFEATRPVKHSERYHFVWVCLCL